MFVAREGESDLRKELGLTIERANELMRITRSIMDQSNDGEGHGMTSHVLLGIAGRKDLTDVEKILCTFMFACKIAEEKNAVDMKNIESIKNMPKIMDLDMVGLCGNISGMIVAPQGVDLPELVTVVMVTLISLVKQMSKSDAQSFCRYASVSFAKMALTGDMKF